MPTTSFVDSKCCGIQLQSTCANTSLSLSRTMLSRTKTTRGKWRQQWRGARYKRQSLKYA